MGHRTRGVHPIALRGRLSVKVLVFLEHDIICRNFVMSGALSALPTAADVKFVFPDAECKRMKVDPAALPLGAPFERLQVDSTRQQIWQWLLFADQLRWRPGEQDRAIRRFRCRALGWKAAALLTLAGLPGLSWFFRRQIDLRLASRPNLALAALLDRENPDVVLHPSVLESVFMNDLVGACAARRIPLVVAMNSWDNPSTKRAVVGMPNLLLVWGPQTREHARRYMSQPEAGPEEFGAAQFDVFREPPRITRADYCRQLGLNPARRLVLFAGSNAGIDEMGVIDALDEAVASGGLPDVAIIYRPHPWGGGGRDGARLSTAEWRNVVVDPTMHDYIQSLTNDRTRISLPDARDTHDLLSIADVVVSPLSTILLEAMLHGKKPIALIQSGSTMTDILPFAHFKEFLELPSVGVAHSIDDLLAMFAAAPSPAVAAENAEIFKQAATWFVRPFERPWRERIVDRLAAVAATSKAARA